MSEVFNVGDPDAEVVYPITDETGGDTDWPNPQVIAGPTTVDAEWLGDPAPVRDLRIPLADLSVGTYLLWLVIPNLPDLLLGEVSIVDPAVLPPAMSTECLWPLDPSCLGDEWDTYSEAVKVRARRLASATLSRLTGGRVGVCPITVRPVPDKQTCWQPGFSMPYLYGTAYPMLYAGRWVNCLPCDTGEPCSVTLPGPVGEVHSVKIDGTELEPTDYRVSGTSLIWMGDGECPFPARQDLTKPDTEEGTFSVTYLNAAPVGLLGAQAAGTLALEYARACGAGSKKCRLPAGVRTISRQGITMEIPNGAFPDGRTGIVEVDNYIAGWNPRNLLQAPVVWSPDVREFSS
jgi:hypothetical protein